MKTPTLAKTRTIETVTEMPGTLVGAGRAQDGEGEAERRDERRQRHLAGVVAQERAHHARRELAAGELQGDDRDAEDEPGERDHRGGDRRQHAAGGVGAAGEAEVSRVAPSSATLPKPAATARIAPAAGITQRLVRTYSRRRSRRLIGAAAARACRDHPATARGRRRRGWPGPDGEPQLLARRRVRADVGRWPNRSRANAGAAGGTTAPPRAAPGRIAGESGVAQRFQREPVSSPRRP